MNRSLQIFWDSDTPGGKKRVNKHISFIHTNLCVVDFFKVGHFSYCSVFILIRSINQLYVYSFLLMWVIFNVSQLLCQQLYSKKL
jgi:hypothetical protein